MQPEHERCWTGRRSCRDGILQTTRRSRCGAGGDAQRSPRSRRSRAGIRSSVRSGSAPRAAIAYEVEIRSLDQHINSCGCIDHRVNGLGTCKHIEGVLAALQRQDPEAFRKATSCGNPRVEIFLDRRETPQPMIAWPQSGRPSQATREWLRPFLKSDGTLEATPKTVAGLIAARDAGPAGVRRQVRLSRHFGPWLEREARQRSRGKIACRVPPRGRARQGQFRSREVAPAALPARGHAAPGVRRAGAAGRRDGARQDRAGDRCLRAAGSIAKASSACWSSARPRSRPSGRSRSRAVHRPPGKSVFGPGRSALQLTASPTFFNIVNYEQVLCGRR